MCGRYAIWDDPEILAEGVGMEPAARSAAAKGAPRTPSDRKSFNACPGQTLPLLLERITVDGSKERFTYPTKWGFLPEWAARKPVAQRRAVINARAETLVEKPYFRQAATHSRCLVPLNGYYEWAQQASATTPAKQPFFFTAPECDTPATSPLLTVAGIYSTWRDPQAQPNTDGTQPWVRTFAIVTRPAPDHVAHIHDRCPLLVPPQWRDAWLDSQVLERDAVTALIDALPAPVWRTFPANRAVGDVRNNYPELLDPEQSLL